MALNVNILKNDYADLLEVKFFNLRYDIIIAYNIE